MFVKLISNSTKRFTQGLIPEDETPLLGLRLSLLSVEKDMPNLMNWHIRSYKHAIRCMKKIIKTVELE
jgi:hypothetical protein